MEKPSRYADDRHQGVPMYDKEVFFGKLDELGDPTKSTRLCLEELLICSCSNSSKRRSWIWTGGWIRADRLRKLTKVIRLAGHVQWTQARFDRDSELSERVASGRDLRERRHGDAASFRFTYGDGSVAYFADLHRLRRHSDPAAADRDLDFRPSGSPLSTGSLPEQGDCLFPRQIEGRYAALSRQDNETTTRRLRTICASGTRRRRSRSRPTWSPRRSATAVTPRNGSGLGGDHTRRSDRCAPTPSASSPRQALTRAGSLVI